MTIAAILKILSALSLALWMWLERKRLMMQAEKIINNDNTGLFRYMRVWHSKDVKKQISKKRKPKGEKK